MSVLPPVLTTWVLAALLVVTPQLAFWSSRQAWIPLALAGLVVLGALMVRRAPWPRPGPTALAIGLGLAWSLVTLAWAPDGGRVLRVAANIGGLALAGGLLCHLAAGARQRSLAAALTALAVALFAVVPLLVADHLSGNTLLADMRTAMNWEVSASPSFYNPALTTLIVLAGPVAGLATVPGLGRGVRLGVAALAALLFALPFLFISASAQAAVLAAVLAAPIAAIGGRRAVRTLGVLAALFLLVAPWLLSQPFQDPWVYDQVADDIGSRHRVQVWAFTADRIAEAPILGWGLDAARAIPGGDTLVPLAGPGEDPATVPRGQNLPLHPHSGALQLWLELGVPGVAAGMALTVLVFFRIAARAQGRLDLAWLTATAVTAFTVAQFSYGLWQSWWQALLWLAVLTALMVRRLNPGVKQ